MIIGQRLGMISNDDKYRINTPMMSAFSILSLSRVSSTTATFALAFILGLSLLTLLSIIGYNNGFSIISSAYARPAVSPDGPTLNDPNLIVETVYQGLKSPTSMAFLGPDDILVLEKGQGTVQRIINGEILPEPLLQVDVTSKDERGLLGIAIASPQEGDEEENREQEESATLATTTTETTTTTRGGSPPSSPTYVFLFFTEAGESKDDTPAGNRVYKYELVENNTKLVNPTLILDLPATPDDSHVGGALQIGPDNHLYLTIGDQRPTAFDRTDDPDSQTKAQNYADGIEPDGRAGILRITQDGGVVGGNEGIFGNEHPLNKYYAIGVKNSFGIDFDPVTGYLWDTENGPTFGDEINLVEPGFNSGWASIQGFWTLDDGHKKVEEVIPTSSINAEEEENNYGLVDFDGKGKYSSPEFVWDVAPTAISFLNSDRLGQQYVNDMFVGDAKYGNLYHFKLDAQRTGLLLDGPLEDRIGTIEELEQQGAVFGHGFGVITDIEVGPDGYLYVLSFGKEGNLYRIVPIAANS
jgi:glucose/arabinose dehydrogenase